MKEYWNSALTEMSWKILQELRKKYNFIVIGGWAVYLWTNQQKSKDIDIVVDIKELQKLKAENLAKNDRLHKYEIKHQEADVGIYVAYYSKLAVPVEDIRNYSSSVGGFKVASKEALLILKQGAEMQRHDSVKGEKDRIDIASLLFSGFDYKKYKGILVKYGLENYIGHLLKTVSEFKDCQTLHLTPRELKLKKEDSLRELRKK